MKYIRIETNDGRVFNYPVEQTTEVEWIREYHDLQANMSLQHKAPKISHFLNQKYGNT
jgi:hypothetical protein